MSRNMNVLLCFDSNYNIQAEVTINSLLNNSSDIINFYLIHDNPESFVETRDRILSNKYTGEVNIYKFVKREGVKFPNFEESHMSEATYYRIFIGDYIPSEVKEIMYIDPDIICINPITNLYHSTVENLIQSKHVLSAKTEHFEKLDSEVSIRLELTNNKYFNAGVTFINYKKWLDEELTDKLTSHMSYLGERVLWYDQDIMNSYLNGSYLELPPQLNYTKINTPYEKVKDEAVLYHYWGKMKPWTIKGILNYGESFYQIVYRGIFEENYHIVHRYKRDSLKQFFILVITLKIFKLKSPFKFINNFISSFGE